MTYPALQSDDSVAGTNPSTILTSSIACTRTLASTEQLHWTLAAQSTSETSSSRSIAFNQPPSATATATVVTPLESISTEAIGGVVRAGPSPHVLYEPVTELKWVISNDEVYYDIEYKDTTVHIKFGRPRAMELAKSFRSCTETQWSGRLENWVAKHWDANDRVCRVLGHTMVKLLLEFQGYYSGSQSVKRYGELKVHPVCGSLRKFDLALIREWELGRSIRANLTKHINWLMKDAYQAGEKTRVSSKRKSEDQLNRTASESFKARSINSQTATQTESANSVIDSTYSIFGTAPPATAQAISSSLIKQPITETSFQGTVPSRQPPTARATLIISPLSTVAVAAESATVQAGPWPHVAYKPTTDLMWILREDEVYYDIEYREAQPNTNRGQRRALELVGTLQNCMGTQWWGPDQSWVSEHWKVGDPVCSALGKAFVRLLLDVQGYYTGSEQGPRLKSLRTQINAIRVTGATTFKSGRNWDTSRTIRQNIEQHIKRLGGKTTYLDWNEAQGRHKETSEPSLTMTLSNFADSAIDLPRLCIQSSRRESMLKLINAWSSSAIQWNIIKHVAFLNHFPEGMQRYLGDELLVALPQVKMDGQLCVQAEGMKTVLGFFGLVICKEIQGTPLSPADCPDVLEDFAATMEWLEEVL